MKKYSFDIIAKARCRGALFVEYALLFAFVVIVGAYFVSADGMQNPVKNIISATESLLGSTANKDNALPSFSTLAKNQFWASGTGNTVSGALSSNNKMFASGEKITLGPGTYEISWDYKKFGDAVGSDASQVRMGLMGYDADNKLVIDPGVDGSRSVNNVSFSQSGTTKTYTVTIDKETSFGVNFDAYNVSGGYNYGNASNDNGKLNQAIQDSSSVKKVN